MLEKLMGVPLVNKLWAITLMEAYLNLHNKLIFGKRILETDRAQNLVPEEELDEKDSTVEDGFF